MQFFFCSGFRWSENQSDSSLTISQAFQVSLTITMFGRAQSIIGLGAARLGRNVFSANPVSIRRFAMVSKQYKSFDKDSDRNSNKNAGQSSPAVLRNDNIMFPLMRVVYTNSETGEPDWKIMTRTDALSFAKKMDLDLILGIGTRSCLRHIE